MGSDITLQSLIAISSGGFGQDLCKEHKLNYNFYQQDILILFSVFAKEYDY